jgi:hypothetical protein
MRGRIARKTYINVRPMLVMSEGVCVSLFSPPIHSQHMADCWGQENTRGA